MAEMGLTPTDRWHLLGKHGCHYVDSADFVEIREFDELELTHPEWGTLGVPSGPGSPDENRWLCVEHESATRSGDVRRLIPA